MKVKIIEFEGDSEEIARVIGQLGENTCKTPQKHLSENTKSSTENVLNDNGFIKLELLRNFANELIAYADKKSGRRVDENRT